MICKWLDANGQQLHEGDTVLLDRPGVDGKVIGTLEFYARRGFWGVKVQKVFSARAQQFVEVNPGAVDVYESISPHVRLFSHILKHVELLEAAARRPRRRPYGIEEPESCWY